MIRTKFSNLLCEAGRYISGSPNSRIRQSRALRTLDDRLLDDVGLSALRAVGKPNCEAVQQKRVPGILVRNSGEGDMATVQRIYASHVLHGISSFEETPPSVDELVVRRRAVLSLGLPYLVAEADGNLVGYCYASTYRPRTAYRFTIENSVYVADGCGGAGIGSALLGELILRCEQGPWRQMLAVIGNSANAGSLALHRRFGFNDVGTFRSVGFKHGRWVDTVLMQRPLNGGDYHLPEGVSGPGPAR